MVSYVLPGLCSTGRATLAEADPVVGAIPGELIPGFGRLGLVRGVGRGRPVGGRAARHAGRVRCRGSPRVPRRPPPGGSTGHPRRARLDGPGCSCAARWPGDHIAGMARWSCAGWSDGVRTRRARGIVPGRGACSRPLSGANGQRGESADAGHGHVHLHGSAPGALGADEVRVAAQCNPYSPADGIGARKGLSSAGCDVPRGRRGGTHRSGQEEVE